MSNASKIYGKTFTTYNIHSLIHITDDVQNHGVDLNQISSFPFENYLQVLKKIVRNSQNPVVQITKRIKELEGSGATISRKVCQTKVSTDERNCWFINKAGQYLRVNEINDGVCICSVINSSDTEDFFIDLCKSTLVEICRVRKTVHMRRKNFEINKLGRKVFCFSLKDHFVLLPLCHNEN